MRRDDTKVLLVVLAMTFVAMTFVKCATPAHAAVCVPDDPAPVAIFDLAPGTPPTPITGYGLYVRQPGGTWQLVRQFPTERNDLDEDGIDDAIYRRGHEGGLPVFRYYNGTANTLYEFAMDAYGPLPPYAPCPKSNVWSACRPVYCVKGSPCN